MKYQGGKLPGYLKLVRVTGQEMHFQVRRWHPSLLAEILRTAREMGIPRWHPRLWWGYLKLLWGGR